LVAIYSLKREFPMRSLVILLIVVPVLTGACKYRIHDQVVGSGNGQVQKRDVPSFDSISTEGALDIKVVCQKPQTLEVEGDDNILPLISTEVSNQVLHIRILHNYSVQDSIKLRISVPNLNFLSVSGAGKIDVSGLKNDKFEMDVNGAPTLRVSGETKFADIDARGAGKIDAHNLLATRALVDSKGVARVEVHAIEELNVDISGPSHVIYEGSPVVNKTVHGPGSVEKRQSTGA